mmetsp:Transcript_5981/g.15268  ORF Transcript_5981/g.15268 Transcript_5981/m.15268 type:complete len:324 (+) Transcript_5981:42-1013(+)
MVAEDGIHALRAGQMPRKHTKSGFLLGRSIDSPHGSINYVMWGSSDRSRPLVVTLHGLLGAMHGFAGLANKMASHGFNVLTFDLFGFGLSKSPSKRFNVELYVQQTMDLLSLLGYAEEKRFYVIGFSMGGLIAMELARRFPQRVARTLLVAPAGLVSLSRSQRYGIRALKLARSMRIPAASVLAKLSKCVNPNSIDFEPDICDAELSQQAAEQNAKMFWSDPEKYTKAWLKSVRDMRLAGGQDVYEGLATSGAEVMFMWGDADCTVPLHEVQDDLRAFFPTAPVLVVKDAGHSLLLEHSDIVAFNAMHWFHHTGPTPPPPTKP